MNPYQIQDLQQLYLKINQVTFPKKIETLKGINICMIASYNEHTAALACPKLEATTTSFRSDMHSLVNDSEFADITFIVGEGREKIYGHKAILATRCEYFAQMFRSGMNIMCLY